MNAKIGNEVTKLEKIIREKRGGGSEESDQDEESNKRYKM